MDMHTVTELKLIYTEGAAYQTFHLRPFVPVHYDNLFQFFCLRTLVFIWTSAYLLLYN